MNYYQHHIGDFRSGTVHMSRVERWIYRDMLEVCYDTERPLPSDLDALCRSIGVREDEERQLVIQLLKFKFEQTEEGYVQKRCVAEISTYHAKGDKARENSQKRGNRAKTPPQAEPIGYQAGTKSDTHTNPDATGSVTNQEPVTSNHEPVNTFSTPNGVDVANGVGDPHPARNSKLNCPHQDIINLYHEILPMCPRVRDWTAARQAHLRARWNEDPERQNLDYWRRFFEYVATCGFLVGQSSTRKDNATPFFANLEWMVKSSNFTNIREGKYDNR